MAGHIHRGAGGWRWRSRRDHWNFFLRGRLAAVLVREGLGGGIAVITLPPIDLTGSSLAAVRFQFVDVTTALATEWLKVNTKNRKPKVDTIEGYARDMKNDDWLTTHQGIAFNDQGELIDGQNRLMAAIRAGVTVRMLVSTGWPKKLGKNNFTMDAVDMGCVRSLADQMELQHGIINSKFVCQTAGALAKMICGGFRASKKQSVSSVLAVAGIYKDQFNWLGENVTTTIGLRPVNLNSVIVMGLVAWPEKTKEFYNQIKTGLNLTASNPVYPLRQWLLTNRIGNSQDEIHKMRNASAHHLKLFVDGRTTGSLVTTSNQALLDMMKLNGDRISQVRALFDVPDKGEKKQKINWRQPPKEKPQPAEIAQRAARDPDSHGNAGLQPWSPDGIEFGRTRLHDPWSINDISCQLDGGQKQVAHFIGYWKGRGWIDPVGFNSFRKTEKFGKM